MKKFLSVVAVSILGAGLSMPVFAETSADEAMRAEHYEAKIETTEEAFKALDEKVEAIANILQQGDELDFLALEKIHEISYTLEAAVDKIRAEEAADITKIDVLDEAVQAIHYASEEQEEAKTREWFAKLEPAAGDIKTKTDELKPEQKEFYTIVIKDHKFSPEELIVPAGQKIKLIVDNQDSTPEEFESHDMNREKIIAGNKQAKIFVGPLKPGKYHYFGEFNMDTANGYIIAK